MEYRGAGRASAAVPRGLHGLPHSPDLCVSVSI